MAKLETIGVTRRKFRRSLATAILLFLATSVNYSKSVISVLGVPASALDMGAHAAEPSPWVQLKGEKPALSLDQTVLSGQPMDHLEYEHINGSRSDWAISGSLALAQPNLIVMVTRRVQPEAARSSVVKDLEDFGELSHGRDRIRRRELSDLVGGAACWPIAVAAQQPTSAL